MHDHGHEHGHPHPAQMSGVLQAALAVTLGLVVAELIGGYVGNSLALVSDAVHNLTDVPALALSWLALRWAERPPTQEKTYGYHRGGILAAFVNAILLVLVALFIFYEAYQRLRQPVEVREELMLWISVLALAVNGGITLALLRGRRDLNLRSLLIHNLGDALSNVAVIVGALVIGWTGAQWLDPAIGMLIGALVLWSSRSILLETTHVLLEGLPRGMSLEEVARAILCVEGVQEVHDIHIWTLGTDLHALSCHVRIPDMHMEESANILAQIRQRVARDFRITHTTIQFERAGLPRQTQFVMPEPFRGTRG